MKQSLGAKTFLLPTPVLLIGTYDARNKPNIMTAAWGGICSSQPPALAVSVRRTRWTYAAIMERKAFTISIPDRRLVAQADFAGLHSGADMNKFAALELTAEAAEHINAPYVAECPVVIELTLIKSVDVGSHVQFIGEIMDVKVDAECLGEDNLPDVAKIDPIFFAPLLQQYWSIGSFVGRAFSSGHSAARTAVIG